MKVLVVDDDKVATLALKYPLEKLGYEVEVANEGPKAWELIQSESYRLVISDWMMPDLDGIELCKKIRQLNQPHYTYIILVTAKDSKEDLLEALKSGADDLLTKPLDTAQLYARLGVCKRILCMEDTLYQNAEELKKSALQLKTEMTKAKKYGLQLEMSEQELRRQKQLLENQNNFLSNLAITDGLTGLMNHRHFRECLDKSIGDVKTVQQPLSVVLIDIDYFKKFNDTYGHPVGDEILKEVSSILKDYVIEPGLPARYGGEEFILLLPYCNEQKSTEFSEIIREAIEQNNWKIAPVTISVGIATLSGEELNASYIIDLADKALYVSKANGRNRVSHINQLPTNTPET